MPQVESLPVRLVKPYAEEARLLSGGAVLTGLMLLATRNLTRTQQYLTGGLTFTAILIFLPAHRACYGKWEKEIRREAQDQSPLKLTKKIWKLRNQLLKSRLKLKKTTRQLKKQNKQWARAEKRLKEDAVLLQASLDNPSERLKHILSMEIGKGVERGDDLAWVDQVWDDGEVKKHLQMVGGWSLWIEHLFGEKTQDARRERAFVLQLLEFGASIVRTLNEDRWCQTLHDSSTFSCLAEWNPSLGPGDKTRPVLACWADSNNAPRLSVDCNDKDLKRRGLQLDDKTRKYPCWLLDGMLDALPSYKVSCNDQVTDKDTGEVTGWRVILKPKPAVRLLALKEIRSNAARR